MSSTMLIDCNCDCELDAYANYVSEIWPEEADLPFFFVLDINGSNELQRLNVSLLGNYAMSK